MLNTVKYLLLAVLLIPAIGICQPTIEWQQCYGGEGGDSPNLLFPTTDSCYIIVGNTGSQDITDFHGNKFNDAFVVKIDRNGKIKWTKCIGGSDYDVLASGAKTPDGGCIIIGITNSIDGDMSERVSTNDSTDAFIAKLDSSGNLSWLRIYGGIYNESVTTITPSRDGGFLITGDTADYSHTAKKGWIFKIDSVGEVQWSTLLDSLNWVGACTETFLGDYILSGGNYKGAVVLRINAAGKIIWQNNYAGGSFKGSIIESKSSESGEYILSGVAASGTSGIENFHGNNDFWILKIDGSGHTVWSKAYGGSDYDAMGSVMELPDYNLIAIGHTSSNDGDVTNHIGSMFDYTPWVIKLDKNGNMLWQHIYYAPPDPQGYGENYAYNIQPAFGGGYIFAAEAHSDGGDVTGHHGLNYADFWVVKLAPEKLEVSNSKNINSSFQISPNPTAGIGKINYSLEQTGFVSIAIYNILGQKIKSLTNEIQSSGEHELRFDESSLAGGSYFIEVRTTDFSQTLPLRILH